MIFKSLKLTKQDAEEWSRSQSWVWRVPVLVYLAYAGYRHATNPQYSSLFSGITLGIHEMGHVLFSYFGEFLTVAGGSISQVAAPIIAGFLLLRQRDFFGVSVAGSWLSFSLYNLATYIGDARARELPLVGLSSDPIHDWNYLLSHTGLLEADHLLAGLTRLIALLILLTSLIFGGWLCALMMGSKTEGRGPYR
jgi:hypothetical protein